MVYNSWQITFLSNQGSGRMRLIFGELSTQWSQGKINLADIRSALTVWWDAITAIWLHTVWVQKNPPLRGPDISRFSHKRLRIFNRFFTHLLHLPICARLQIFIQLSPILTKLCHIKRDYPVHIICSKCPPSVETHALTLLRKSLIALLIVVCGK